MSSLTRLNPKFKDLKTFLTDDGQNLVSGFLSELGMAEYLQCFRHSKKGIKEHMKGWAEEDKKRILNDLFGMYANVQPTM